MKLCTTYYDYYLTRSVVSPGSEGRGARVGGLWLSSQQEYRGTEPPLGSLLADKRLLVHFQAICVLCSQQPKNSFENPIA